MKDFSGSNEIIVLKYRVGANQCYYFGSDKFANNSHICTVGNPAISTVLLSKYVDLFVGIFKTDIKS